MNDYLQRVIDEKTELDKKLKKLNEFKHNETYCLLHTDEQERLNTQGHLMCAYSAILGARIAAFDEVKHEFNFPNGLENE